MVLSSVGGVVESCSLVMVVGCVEEVEVVVVDVELWVVVVEDCWVRG